MSLLVLGLSHHSAPIEVLERVAADDAAAVAFERRALAGEHVGEAMVLSTCNRTEVYADAATFHGGLTDLTTALTDVTSVPLTQLQPYLYVHYEERGVAHTFTVAAGLDSMAIGEAQILGQLRRALRRAQEQGHVGPQLNGLVQRALRVGKRVHAETAIDTVSHSLVDAALDRAETVVGPLGARTVLVVGAGGMGALAATAAVRRGVGRLLITNRGAERAATLATRLGAEWLTWTALGEALAAADVVLSSTGASGLVIGKAAVEAAAGQRGGTPQLFVDLAVPRDIAPEVATVPSVTLAGLGDLATDLSATGEAPEVREVADLVTAEVAEFVAAQLVSAVAPTVSALRARANEVVDAELTRLARRTPGLAATDRAEVEQAVRRVVDKLLHAPTVRVKELAERGDGGDYARALSELFDLDPRDVSLVSAPVPVPFGTEGSR